MHWSNRSGNARLVSRFALILFSMLASCAWADAAFELEQLSADQLLVAPGSSTNYAMRIRNTGDIASAASVHGWFHIANRFDPAPYTLGPASDARCGSIRVDNPSQIWFDTAIIDPGTALDCEWTIDRPLASKNDTWLAWQTETDPPSSSGLALIGTLTNTSIASRTLDFSIDEQGNGHASIELSVHNGGQLPIDEQTAGACFDWDGGGVAISGDGAGGCGDAFYSPACFTGGGYGFAIPDLRPGQTHRCTLDLSSAQSYTLPLAAEFMISREQWSGHDMLLLDSNEDDNQTYAWLAPLGIEDATPLLSLRWPALGLLILLCGYLGLRRQRSRSD